MIYIAGHKIEDREYHEHVTKSLFQEIFNKEVKILEKPNEKTLFIRFSDKKIFTTLSKYLPIGRKYERLIVPNEILCNKNFLFAYIRGLADTDGCVIFSKQHQKYRYYPRVEITSKSKQFLLTILLKLEQEGFYGSVSHKGNESYRLEIPGPKNLKLWMNQIGFHNPKHNKKVEGYLRNPPKRPGPDLTW